MPMLVPSNSVVVVRDGTRLIVPPGRSFDFTADEAAPLLADGTARLAHSADRLAEPERAPDGRAALAASRRAALDASPKEIAAAAASAAVAAITAAQNGEPPPPAARPARAAKAAKQADEEL